MLYLKRPPCRRQSEPGTICGGRFGYSDLKEAAFVRGGRGGALWDFNRLWLGSYWNEEYLWDDRQSSADLFSHDAKAPNGLIVTRDTSFFKTYCYLIASLESSMSLASGHAEASAAKRLRSSRHHTTIQASDACHENARLQARSWVRIPKTQPTCVLPVATEGISARVMGRLFPEAHLWPSIQTFGKERCVHAGAGKTSRRIDGRNGPSPLLGTAVRGAVRCWLREPGRFASI